MSFDNMIVDSVVSRIDEAINFTIKGFNNQHFKHEPHFTDRMLGAMGSQLNGFQKHGLTFRAKTLTDRGTASQESQYGADFMIVIDVFQSGKKVQKGFLAQAKMAHKQDKNLLTQCNKMLSLSLSSYVFIYDKNNVSVADANDVASAQGGIPHLNRQSAVSFFREVLKCEKGDHGIRSTHDEQLDALRNRYEARSMLLIYT